MIWLDVDAAVEMFVNKVPLVASANGYTIDEGIAYNESGMDLNWNFVTTAGVVSQTNVTPTTGDDHDWVHEGNGMYSIEMPAASGDANNDTEGFGWWSGVADAICPFSSPVYGFRHADVNATLVDGATIDVNVTAMAANVVTAAAIAAAAIDNATFAADVGSTAYATNIIALAVFKALEEYNLDHLMKTAVNSNADMTTEVTDGTVLSNIMTKGSDTSDFVVGTDALEAIRDAVVDSNPQNHAATANNETTGTLDSGTYADTASVNNTYYQLSPVTPAVGGFGLNVDLTFGIGTGRVPSSVIVTGYFDAAAQRTVQVWAYDYILAAYVQLSNSATDFGNAASNQTFQYAMTTNMVQVSDGEVKIRFTSASITTGDDWYCDYVNVASVAQEAAGLTADAIQEAVWARADSGHDRETLGHAVETVHSVDALVVSATDASQFIIDTGVANNDAFNGMLCIVQDLTDDHHETKRITDYIGATKEVFVDRAFSFTPAAGDYVHIIGTSYADVNVTHVGATAQTANDNGLDINALVTALVNKTIITEASGNTEQFNDADSTLGSIAAAFSTDGTYTARKRMVI